jgi:hypothetical protein
VGGGENRGGAGSSVLAEEKKIEDEGRRDPYRRRGWRGSREEASPCVSDAAAPGQAERGDGTIARRNRGGGGGWRVGPALYSVTSNGFKFELVKCGLMLLKKFQIKYGCVGIEIRNKFPHCIFSNFGTGFELKFREPN